MRDRIPQLDAVRGIAILLVILHNESVKFPTLHLESLFANGWMGHIARLEGANPAPGGNRSIWVEHFVSDNRANCSKRIEQQLSCTPHAVVISIIRWRVELPIPEANLTTVFLSDYCTDISVGGLKRA